MTAYTSSNMYVSRHIIDPVNSINVDRKKFHSLFNILEGKTARLWVDRFADFNSAIEELAPRLSKAERDYAYALGGRARQQYESRYGKRVNVGYLDLVKRTAGGLDHLIDSYEADSRSNDKVVYLGGHEKPSSLRANPEYKIGHSNIQVPKNNFVRNLRSSAIRTAATAVLAIGFLTGIPDNSSQVYGSLTPYLTTLPTEISKSAELVEKGAKPTTIDKVVEANVINSNLTGLKFNQLPNSEDLASKLKLNEINYSGLPSDVAKQWFSFWIESNLDKNSLKLTSRFNPKAPDIQNLNVYMFIDPAKVTVIGTTNYRWLDNPNGGKILKLKQGAPVYISLSDAEKSAFESRRIIPDMAGGYIENRVLNIVTSVDRLGEISSFAPKPESVVESSLEESEPAVTVPLDLSRFMNNNARITGGGQ